MALVFRQTLFSPDFSFIPFAARAIFLKQNSLFIAKTSRDNIVMYNLYSYIYVVAKTRVFS